MDNPSFQLVEQQLRAGSRRSGLRLKLLNLRRRRNDCYLVLNPDLFTEIVSIVFRRNDHMIHAIANVFDLRNVRRTEYLDSMGSDRTRDTLMSCSEHRSNSGRICKVSINDIDIEIK